MKGWLGLILIGVSAAVIFTWSATRTEPCVVVYKAACMPWEVQSKGDTPFELRHVMYQTSLGNFHQFGSKFYLTDDIFLGLGEITDKCIIAELQKFWNANYDKNNGRITCLDFNLQ